MPSGRSRRHVSLGAASLAVGGAAFALIQILQGTVGAFNPRPIVTALIAVGAALLGSTLGRLRQNALDARRLTELLRVWPLKPLADCDALTLGVFPPRQLQAGEQPADGLPPYVSREIDAELREALQAGGLVLVVGPERSGKSRTAYEAARAVLADDHVVIPVDGTSLTDLADDAWSGFGADALWWLDDLERFLDQMGGPELSLVADQGLRVIATLREERWQTLLRGVGDEGERGRRLRGAARVFRLETKLTDAEVLDARRLFGDVDTSRGIGDALRAPEQGSVQRPASSPPARRPHDPVLGLVAAATVAVMAALALVIAGGGFSPVKPPPIGAQIDAIREQAAKDGKVTVVARPVDLHGFDQQSYVFVMRPSRQGSDELRVYDVVDGRLKLMLDYQPHTLRRGSPSPAAVVQQARRLTPPFDLGVEGLRAVDIYGNGEHELVADYNQLPFVGGNKFPIVVAWDDVAQRYRLQALIASRPTAAPNFGRPQSQIGSPYVLRDTSSGAVLLSWPVAAYVLKPATGSTPATLTIGTDVSTATQFGVLVDTYSLTPSAGRVSVGKDCGAAVYRSADYGDQQLLHILLYRHAAHLSILPGTATACTA